jgi:hypothetical protein
MGFFRKILGVEELEKKVDKNIKQMETNLKTSWNWINYLHELEQDNKLKIKTLIEENQELKELIKGNHAHIVPELSGEKSELKHEKKAVITEESALNEEIAEENSKSNAMTFKNIDISGLGKKEAYILQILYQMACFDASSAIETSKIYENLPYSITMRGLRKKMYKFQEQGIVNSVMVGNSRRWFLDMSKVSRLKEFLSEHA